MSFRARLLLVGFLVGCLPVLVLGLVLREQGRSGLAQAQSIRIGEWQEGILSRFATEQARLDAGVGAVAARMSDDPEFRDWLAGGGGPSFDLTQVLIEAATLSGLDALWLLDAQGQVLASSHFQGDAGRQDLALLEALQAGDGPWAAEVQHPAGPVVSLIRRRVFTLGAREITAVAGVALRSDWAGFGGALLALGEDPRSPPSGATLSAAWPAEAWSNARMLESEFGAGTRGSTTMDTVAAVLSLPSIGPSPNRSQGRAVLLVGWTDLQAKALLETWDRALILALVAVAVLAFLLSSWMASRMSAPLQRLTESARRVHLGRLNVRFPEKEAGEIGRLGRFLNGMLTRLREGVLQLQEAERRATQGELARQVNHDLRNGLIPIRNVLRHLNEANSEGPEALADVFGKRGGTLAGSLDYLTELAEHYRGVADHGTRRPTDLIPLLREVLESPRFEDVETGNFPRNAWVAIDPVSLRRILENLLGNAVDAVQGSSGRGRVWVSVDSDTELSGTRHMMTIGDDGPGLSVEDQGKVFDPFFSLKKGGTGLGLPIVRRLVGDVGGSVVLSSTLGKGTKVVVSLSAAAPKDGALESKQVHVQPADRPGPRSPS